MAGLSNVDGLTLTNPSGSSNFKGSTTFTSLPTSSNTVGDLYMVTDLLNSLWVWDGAWEPLGPQVVAAKTAVTDGAIQIADQIIGQLSLPAGLLVTNRLFRVVVEAARSGSTDAAGQFTFRLGTAGTTADTNIGSQAGFVSGNISSGMDRWWRVISTGANSVVQAVGVAANSPYAFSSTTGNAFRTQVTLTGLDLSNTATFLSTSAAMTAATVNFPRTGYLALELRPA